MSWRDQLRSDLKRDEGVRLTTYLDTEGIPTIGVGRNLIAAGDPDRKTCTTEEMENWLTEDMLEAIHGAKRIAGAAWEHHPDDVKRGLSNMCFNLGESRLRGFTRMLNALRAGDYGLAAREALNSKWHRQVKGRARRIAKLYEEST